MERNQNSWLVGGYVRKAFTKRARGYAVFNVSSRMHCHDQTCSQIDMFQSDMYLGFEALNSFKSDIDGQTSQHPLKASGDIAFQGDCTTVEIPSRLGFQWLPPNWFSSLKIVQWSCTERLGVGWALISSAENHFLPKVKPIMVGWIMAPKIPMP